MGTVVKYLSYKYVEHGVDFIMQKNGRRHEGTSPQFSFFGLKKTPRRQLSFKPVKLTKPPRPNLLS
jgi:hypothetical protein